MNAEGIALLRALIFKMWSLNEARDGGDCEAIAELVNSWMPPGCKVTAAHVDLALRGEAAKVTVNVAILRDKIDRSPVLYSARLNGDYQAILNECMKDSALSHATLADVVQAMAMRRVSMPSLVVVGKAALVGASRIG